MTERRKNTINTLKNVIERRLLKDRRSHPFHRFFLSLIGYHRNVRHPFSRIMLAVLTYICCLSIYISTNVLPNPSGGQVMVGNASIQQGPNSTVINQSSQQAIIHWQSFNIGRRESTHFQQPAGGIALNRINPQQGASQIYGVLTATGRIILVNSAGIYFGPSAYVNVGGIIASTSNITNENFLAGRYIFNQPSPYGGSIVNQGRIIAQKHGLVALLGTGVDNSGVIQAKMGTVILASGNKFTLNFSGDQLINFTVDEQASQAGVDRHGNRLKYGVNNTGQILANGGTVLISAEAASGVLDKAINIQGIVEAKSVGVKNGEIILNAGPEGSVNVSGKLIASGKRAGEKGGTVKILGNQVALTDNAVVDVSGNAGGGKVLIGGNAHGAGPEQNADYTFVGKGANIYANGLVVGDGGVVVVWSNKATSFNGNIFAQGGTQAGNGGFVETSGKNYLEAFGTVNASATHGNPGIWLLDPANVTITAATTTNGVFSGGNPNTFTTTANDAIANVNTIIASLNAGTSVTILTTPSGSQSGDITVSSPISKTAGGAATLTLTASNTGTININQAITSTVGNLAVILNGANAINLAANVTTLNGAFTAALSGVGSILQTAGTISTGTGARTFTVPTTSTGSIGTSATPIATTGTGTLTLTAGAGGAFINNTGNFTLAAPTLNANSPLTVTSTGVLTLPNAVISTGTGNIDFESRGGILSTVNTLNTTSGTITLFSSGLLTIADNLTTTGGNVSLTGLGVTQSNAIVVNAGTGNITANAGTGTLTMGTNSRLLTGNATGSLGAINIIANGIALNTSGTPSQIGGTGAGAGLANLVTIQPSTAGTTIGLAGGAGTLSLTAAETNDIQGANVTIGNSSSGLMTLSAWTPDALFASGGMLTLRSNTGITQNGALNLATSLAGLTENTSGPIAINANITTTNKPISLTGVGITQAATTTVNAGSANLTYNAGSGTITTNTGDLLLTTGTVSLIANSMTLSTAASSQIGGSALNVGTATNAILTEGTTGTTIGLGGGVGTLNLTQAELNVIHASNAQIGDSNAGLITIGTLTAGTTFVPSPGTGVLTLYSGNGMAVQAAGGITMNNLILRGAGTMNLTTNASNNITNLAANLTSGSLSLTNAANNPLTITTLTDTLGTVSGISAGGSTNVALANSGTGDINFNANASSGSGNIVATAGRNIILNAGNISTTGNITLTGTAGSINEAGAGTISGALLTTSSTGGTTLNNANAISNFIATNVTSGNIALTNTLPLTITSINQAVGNLSIINSNTMNLGNITLGTGTLTLAASGTISETGAITQAANAGAITLSQNAANADILLTQANNLTGSINFAGTLSNIRDVTLHNINANAILPSNLTALSNLRNLAVTFENTGITLPGLTVGGNLTVTVGGSILQSGALLVSGLPTFAITTTVSGIADILLASAANNFMTTPVITSSGDLQDVALRNIAASATVPTLPSDLRNLTLNFDNAGITLPSMTLLGNLNVTAGGIINQSGPLNISNAGAITTLSAGSGNDISLTNNSNNFATVAINSGNNVSLADINNINLAASTISGNLTINASDEITQSGILNVNGLSTFTTGSSGNITLTNPSNDFATAAFGGGNNISIADINNLILGASTMSGNLSVTTQGTITQSGALNLAGPTQVANFAANSGNITLTNPSNVLTNLAITSGNDVSVINAGGINLYPSSISGNFNLTTSGAITQTGALILTGLGKTLTLNAGSAGDITLNTLTNSIPAITISNARAVSIDDVSDLTLGPVSSTSLTATSEGSLTTSGLIQTAGGNVSLTTTGPGTITIGTSGIKTSLDQISPGGSINIIAANTNDLAISVFLNGELNTQGGTGGNISIGGGVQQSVPPVRGAGNITVAGNATAFILNDNTYTQATVYNIFAQDIIIKGLQQSTGIGSDLTFFADFGNSGLGGVQVTTTGGIISSGNLTIKGSSLLINPGVAIEIQAGSLIQAAGSISLLGNVGNTIIDVDRSMQTTGVNQPITITPAGSGQIELEGNLTTNRGNINLNSTTVLTNNVNFTTNGGIISANAINGVGQTLTLDVGNTTDINLINPNNDLGTVAITNAQNVELVNANAINLGTSNVSGNLTVIAGSDITSSGPLSVAGTATFTANNSGSITLNQANSFNTVAVTNALDVTIQNLNAIDLGPINVTGDLSVTANGPITQNAGAISVSGSDEVATFAAGTANDIILNNPANNFTQIAITSGNNAIIRDSNALNLNNIILAGNLDVTTNGDITQSGIITLAANKTATLAAGSANNISLENSANSISNAVITSGNNVTIDTSGAINFGTSNISGNLSVESFGEITQTGLLTVLGSASFNPDGAPLTLTLNNNFIGPVLLTNAGNYDVAITNSGLLIIGPTASTLGTGTLTLTGLGVQQTGPIVQVAGAGGVTINAGAGSINLADSANYFTGAVSLLNTGNNNATINNSTDLNLAASTVGGQLAATSSGAITLSGSLTANASGDSIVLSGNRFNNAGGYALNPGSSGRFLVWSSNPNPFGNGTADNRGGLAYNFKQYNATYGTSTVLGTGSGFLYTLAPVITPSLVGTTTKSYTGTNPATLTAANYALTGAVDSDVVTLNNPANGIYASTDVGTNLNVSVSGISITSATNGSATVYGYQLSSPSANANIGIITPAGLVITANDLSKTYGQTVTFTGNEFTPTGLQNAETIGSATLTSTGAISTANVSGGPYAIVVADATGGTFNPANYSISYTNGALTINPATLTYNANAASRNYNVANPLFSGTVTGFVNSETQATATTGTMIFTSPASSSSKAGSYAILGSGLTANFGNYLFTQAPGNATALTIYPTSAAPVSPILLNTLIASILTQDPNQNKPLSEINKIPNNVYVLVKEMPGTTNGKVIIEQPSSHAVNRAVVNPLIKSIMTEIQVKAKEAQTTGVVLPLNSKALQNKITSVFPHVPNMFSIKDETNSSYLWNVNFSIIALTGTAVLALATLLGMIAMLYHMQVKAIQSLADTLSKVSADNYIKQTKKRGKVVPVTNACDIEKLLPYGLPKGYKIVPTPTPTGKNVICVLIGPMSTRAEFTVVGVSASSFISSKSTAAET